MVSRRSLLAGVGSLTAGGYAATEYDILGAIAAGTEAGADAVDAWLAVAEWDARAAAEAAHDRVNDLRTSEGLPQLAFDTELYDIARDYAARMATEDFYAHEDPQGRDFADRYQAAGYQCSAGGYTGAENIAQTHWEESVATDDGGSEYLSTPADVGVSTAEGWWASPGHRENILIEAWDGHAIAFAKSDADVIYAVQNFC